MLIWETTIVKLSGIFVLNNVFGIYINLIATNICW